MTANYADDHDYHIIVIIMNVLLLLISLLLLYHFNQLYSGELMLWVPVCLDS